MSRRALRPLILFLALAGSSAALAQKAPAQGGKKVIVLVGLPGSGKSTAAGRLSAKLNGVPRWTSGDVIRNTIRARGLPYTPENDKAVAAEFAGKPGEIGRRIAAEVAAAPGGVAIVEGFRTPADLAEMKKAFPDTIVVSIEVSAKRRYQRMLGRGRAGEDNVAFLQKRDQRELGLGVREVMKQATVRIRPRGNDLDSLDRSLDRVRRMVEPSPTSER